MDQVEHEPTVTQFHRSCLERNTNKCNKRNFTWPAYTPTSSFSFIYLFVGDKELGKTILITYTLSRSPGQQVFFSASSLLSYDIINKCCPVVANRALFDLDHLSL